MKPIRKNEITFIQQFPAVDLRVLLILWPFLHATGTSLALLDTCAADFSSGGRWWSYLCGLTWNVLLLFGAQRRCSTPLLFAGFCQCAVLVVVRQSPVRTRLRGDGLQMLNCNCILRIGPQPGLALPQDRAEMSHWIRAGPLYLRVFSLEVRCGWLSAPSVPDSTSLIGFLYEEACQSLH
jgi:hypothetical protein